MVVGFLPTYHHWCCELESRSSGVCSIQHNVIQFVSDLWQVAGLPSVLWFPPPIKLTPRYSWHIVGSGVKHRNPLYIAHCKTVILIIRNYYWFLLYLEIECRRNFRTGFTTGYIWCVFGSSWPTSLIVTWNTQSSPPRD